MTYREYINGILQMRPNERKDGVYMERHHIIPKCMGGDNSEYNLVWLFPREHFIAHKLLFNENRSNNKIAFAYWSMCGNLRHKRYDSEIDKDEARKAWYDALNGENGARLKKCICLETRKVYNSLKEAAKDFNTTIKIISKVCKDNKRSYKGIHFDFYNPEKHTEEYIKKEIEFRIKRRIEAQKPSKETMGKCRLAKIGKKRPDVAGKNNKNARPVLCLTTGVVFDTLKEAADNFGIRIQDVYSVCSGRQKSSHGYKFSYFGDKK